MLKFSVVLCTISALTTTVCAHDGRRLEIKVVDNQLVAHGYVSNGVDDGGGLVRPYYNTIHGHWTFDPTPGVVAASADLPGFDLFDSGALAGHSLELTVVGATK
ncbi:MAG: hypothetical protein KDA30_12415, partial [Phycisphaerales bacterium]|nr:hypothetical protein [Phycisphaerales bacterium]